MIYIGTLLTALVTIGPAMAQTIYDGVRPSEVQRIISDLGYRAQLGKSESGTSYIASAANGLNFVVYFYTCGKDDRCTSVQFVSRWNTNGKDNVDVGKWNDNRRFLAAFRRPDGDLTVKMDANFDAGVTQSHIEDTFKLWTTFLATFDEFRASGKL